MTLHTRASLAADLRRLGLAAGDLVMVHAAFRRVGPVLGGPDTLIAALRDAVGEGGTLAAYVDWHVDHGALLDADGRVLPGWREHVPPFDPRTARAIRDHGVLAEFLRTTPGAPRSANPGASVAAVGARAAWLTADHPLDYGYGPGTPLAKLVEAGGRVLLIGAPLDTMTLLHLAEHLARVPGKRIRRVEVPFATEAGTAWRMVEEYETGEPVVAGLAEDCFAEVVRDVLATGQGRQGPVGGAPAGAGGGARHVRLRRGLAGAVGRGALSGPKPVHPRAGSR